MLNAFDIMASVRKKYIVYDVNIYERSQNLRKEVQRYEELCKYCVMCTFLYEPTVIFSSEINKYLRVLIS